MPDKEPAKGMSGWTVGTLFVHFCSLVDSAEKKTEQRFQDQEKAVRAALVEQEKAVGKSEMNAEKWRSNANEWRAAMTDREHQFMPRAEAEAANRSNSDKISALEARLNRTEGKGQGLNAMWGYVVAAIMLAIALIGFFINLKR